mgnify:CR=1 FL=1
MKKILIIVFSLFALSANALEKKTTFDCNIKILSKLFLNLQEGVSVTFGT